MLITKEQLEGIASFGYRLYQDGKFDEASTLFRGLTVVAEDSFYGYAGLGAVALAKDPPDLNLAVQYLSKAVELNPEEPTMRANLGEALLRKGAFEEAGVELHKAMDLDPEKINPGVNRARAIIEGLRIATEELQHMAGSRESS